MLTVCHRKRPKLCKQLLKRIMEYLSSRSAAPGVRSEGTLVLFCPGWRASAVKCFVTLLSLLFCSFLSPLLVFLKDQASSRLIDTIIQLSHKSFLRDLYKNHLKGQLVDLALHPIANFPVQRLTAASAKHKLVGLSVGCDSARRIKVRMCLIPIFSPPFSPEVPEVVWWADPRCGGHLGSRSHGSHRPTGRELRRKWGETGRADAVPAPRKHGSVCYCCQCGP